MDPIRRKILQAGAAATAMAAAPRVFAQQAGPAGAGMSFYEKGSVRIRYEAEGSGFPLLLIAGGGLNSTIAGLRRGDPFNAFEEFKGEYRCIAADLRNANGGQSSGPLEIDRPWDAYTDDHIGLMDHLGIGEFLVMGFCIGGPFIWNLLKRAPDRIAAAVLAQPSGSRPEMRDLFYEKGPVRIHFEEAGSGFPLLLIPGGGLNSTLAGLKRGVPFHAIDEFKGEYRCIAADLRNANGGQSTGPLEVDRPWDAFTDDHLGLMDHLRIDKFMVLGFCIGGPFIWNLLERAPSRVVAAVTAQPSGFRPEQPDLFYNNNMTNWGPELVKRRPEIALATVERFLTRMYKTNPDFVFTVTRDFVRQCQTPVLVLPDDIPAHPYAVAMETVMLAPKSEVSLFPWKEPPERIPIAVRQIRSFLRAHRPG